MERIKELKVKAEKDKRIADSKIERLKQEIADKEVELMNERRAEVKLQAQTDHEAYLENQQLEIDIKAYEKSDEGRTERVRREGIEKVEQDIAMGLTESEIEYKYLNFKERRECDNAIAEGEVRDIRGFLKRKRLREKASEQNKRRLKGL